MSLSYKLLLTAALAASPVMLHAQGPAEEPPKNLQVLPKDMSREQVIQIMRRFTGALGVRCDACHAQAAGAASNGPPRMDFASDEKENKKIARTMLRMVIDINGKYLPETGRTFTERTRVTCETCHHGASKPRTLAAELLNADDAKGADSAIARYRELRDKNYGRAVFDFGEQSLVGVAEELAHANKIDDAQKLLALNLEYYPKSVMTISSIAQNQAQKGDTASAIATVNKALEGDPNNPMLKRLLAGLKGELRRPQ